MPNFTKREIILQHAARLFHQKGYPATTMRELAQNVGVEVSSLYSHIKSKEELLVYLCFNNAKKFAEGMEKAEKHAGCASDKIAILISQHLDIALKDGTSATVFDNEWKHLSEPQLSSFIQIRKDYQNRFEALIKQGIEKKELAPIEPVWMINTIINSIRWVHLRPNLLKSSNSVDLREKIIHILMKGIKI